MTSIQLEARATAINRQRMTRARRANQRYAARQITVQCDRCERIDQIHASDPRAFDAFICAICFVATIEEGPR